MSRLTAVVTTYNEAPRIGETLARLTFADEILVVDSFSSDGTADIARGCGARVLEHEYQSPAAQKNWAIGQAAGEWVLIVDADEWVTRELAEEIESTVGLAGGRQAGRSEAANGYEIRRRNFFLGREIRHSGWRNDWVLRLVRRDCGRYHDRQVHELMQVDGPVGRLKGDLIHHPYRSLDDYWRKMRRYAEWNAMAVQGTGSRPALGAMWPLRMLLHPPLRFLKAYLVQGGFLDGVHGLAVCLLTAMYASAKDLWVWECCGAGRPAPAGSQVGTLPLLVGPDRMHAPAVPPGSPLPSRLETCSASKIMSREKAVQRVAQWRGESKRIAYANGCFDIIHAGHVRTLEAARQHGDVLIVGMNSDESTRRLKGPGRPVFGEADRAEMVAALACVDLVVIFPEDSSLPLIQALRPDVWVKGGDYVLETVNQEERAFVESYGGRVVLAERVAGASTSDIIAQIRRIPGE